MDPRMNLKLMESRQAELLQQATLSRRHRAWPDDGLPAKRAPRRSRPSRHPFAIFAELVTWR